MGSGSSSVVSSSVGSGSSSVVSSSDGSSAGSSVGSGPGWGVCVGEGAAGRWLFSWTSWGNSSISWPSRELDMIDPQMAVG